MLLACLLLAAAVCVRAQTLLPITDYGAVAGVDAGRDVTEANSRALAQALLASQDGRGVAHVPAGADFRVTNTTLDGLRGAALRIDGSLHMADEPAWWDTTSKSAMLVLTNTTDFVLDGTGLVNGHGYIWWVRALAHVGEIRPYVVLMNAGTGTRVGGQLRFEDGPGEHLRLVDQLSLRVSNVTVMVHLDGFRAAHRGAGTWDEVAGIPTVPLNTDGIDPSGRDIVIEDCFVQNFDDAIAVKPLNAEFQLAHCTENVVARRLQIVFSVGASIGSVPPHVGVNCIRNVTFSDVTFQSPFKMIYVKANPGTEGTGIVERIRYENIRTVAPPGGTSAVLWTAIYIGPQQQQQPGTAGTGCDFFWPVRGHCPTDPRVTMRDISLANVTIAGANSLPGIVLCDSANPCTGITFDRVNVTGAFVERGDYACYNAQVSSSASSPAPACLSGSPAAVPIVAK